MSSLKGQNNSPECSDFRALLKEAEIDNAEITGIGGNFSGLNLDPEDWDRVAALAAGLSIRFCGVWGEHSGSVIVIRTLLAARDGHILLQTDVPDAGGELPSQTPYFIAADRPERTLKDMFGITFTGHPDPRRWIRHQAWKEDEFPLRHDFPLSGTAQEKTAGDSGYPFIQVEGDGVYEIPVGPVHAGIIEPGHFRFQAMGENILRLEEHLGYVHKGIEKVAVGRSPHGLGRLAARVSGDSTVAHSWAAAMACENATGLKLPPRVHYLRGILSERERIANHLGDIGACCNDVGFAFAMIQFGKLREQWQRLSREIFNHRFMMDVIVPGGVTCDIGASEAKRILDAGRELRDEVTPLLNLLYEYPSLQDRLRTTGHLSLEQARSRGALGYVARASGECWDVRRDAPYPPYDDLAVRVPSHTEGDSAARVNVRGDELLHAIDLIEHLLSELPGRPGDDVCFELPTSSKESAGIGVVEGWRGELFAYVHLDENNSVLRYFPRDPSWLNWPALETLILGEIVPDFPLCNKSVNGSYSGHDL